MAATYPLELVEAYRWQQEPGNAQLQGDQLQAALQQLPWDPSVKSLTAFPQVLKILNDNLQWTEQVGDAFLAQQAAVMDSIQRLRQLAMAAGNLQSTPQQTVETQGPEILIEPAQPDVVYVPSYDPGQVYGAWPDTNYPPYDFPDYAYPGVAFGFGAGIFLGDWWWWNHWDWRHHRLDIDDGRFRDLNRGRGSFGGGEWEHDPSHRRGIPYSNSHVRERFQGGGSNEIHRDFRGYGTGAAPSFSRPVGAPILNAGRPQGEQQRGFERGAVRPNGGMPEQRGETQRPAVPEFQHPAGTPQFQHPAGAQESQRPAAAPQIQRPAAAPEFQRPAAAPEFQRPAAAPQFQHPAAAPEMQRPAAPVFESFAHRPSIQTQSARGAFSRSTAPAFHPAARSGGVSRGAPPPRGGGGGGTTKRER
jgi:hypothetical protein